MAYTFIPVLDHLHKVEALIDKAKRDGKYAGQEKAWDAHVMAVVKTHCSKAEAYIQQNSDVVLGARSYAKERVDTVERLLKQKAMEDKEFQVIQLSAQVIKKKVEEAITDDGELTKACVQYRGGWPVVARKLLADPKLLDPFVATREKGINLGKEVVSAKRRAQEYVVRIEELAKQATQRQKQGAVDMTEFTKDVETIDSRLKEMKEHIADLRFKQKRPVERFEKWKKQKAWSAEDKKEAEQRHPGLAAAAKEARGKLKTMKVLYEGLEKRGKSAGPGWKEQALAAVKAAKGHLSDAEKECKAFDGEEDDATKVYKKMTG